MGKVIEYKEKDKDHLQEFSCKDVSVTARSGEYGTIDKVICPSDPSISAYNAEGHSFIKVRISSLRKPKIGDKFACFDVKTQVLTASGWKYFKDLKLSDQVACLENDSLVYAHPTNVQSYHVNNQLMYTVETSQINLKVTPNHRMYVKKLGSKQFAIDEARNLFNHRLQFKKNCQYMPPNCCRDKFVIPQTTIINDQLDPYTISMDSWVTFFGIWIFNGWTTKRFDCHGGYTTIVVTKPQIKAVLEDLEKELGWEFIRCNGSDNWNLLNVQIYQYLHMIQTSATGKYLPEWVWQLNQNQANLLLNSIFICCGYDENNSDTQLLCTTESADLADDIQRLALHAGLSANIHVRSVHGTPSTMLGNHVMALPLEYEIGVIKSENEPQINNEPQDRWEKYTGQVYCCTVPSGVIYVRREGIPQWSGNSRYSQKGTCSILYKSIDMPFTCYGLVPDIIMNPHGIPSRMTVGKLLETLLGKIAVNTCRMQDATPFVAYDFEQFTKSLEDYGMNKYGNEVMYNGQTGQMFETQFFYGPTYYQRLKHMVDDKIYCLTLDHEVLTASGWKYFQQLTIDDQIATLKDGCLVYERPTKLLYYPDYQGSMYHIKNHQLDLHTTTNHRMWISPFDKQTKTWSSYQLTSADQIYGKYVKYQKDAIWSQPDYQLSIPGTKNQPEKPVDMDAWLTIFGLWIAEGWTTNDHRVHFNHTTGELKTILLEEIGKLGYRSVDDTQITILDPQLCVYLSPYSSDPSEKFLPNWVWNLSQKQCQKLIYNMQANMIQPVGNDTINNSYYTPSIQLANDFMRLCLHAGWASNQSKSGQCKLATMKVGKCVISQHDLWKLTVIKSDNQPTVNQYTNDDTITENCKIPVFCLQVPSEIFYVRHNGLPVWTGNSRESGPVQLLTRQPAEGRSRGGGLRLGEMERDCLIAHGIPKFLKERMMDSSDLFKVFVSKKEETIIIGNQEQQIYKFGGHNVKDDKIMQVQLPYAMKLLLQELESMGIDIRLKVQ